MSNVAFSTILLNLQLIIVNTAMNKSSVVPKCIVNDRAIFKMG